MTKAFFLALALFCGNAFAQTPSPVAIDPALPDYERGGTVTGTVRSIGSSTLSNLLLRWKNEFNRLQPAVGLDITGGGSSSALPALIEGRADIGPMSRPMNKSEIERFSAKFGHPPAGLTVALDAVAVYVNKRNPLTQISFDELRAIYGARKHVAAPMRTWGDLELPGEWANRLIVVKGPSPTQGVYGIFRAAVLGGIDYRFDMRPEPVASSIVQAVAAEEGAIGFASQFLAATRTKTLAIARERGGPYRLPSAERAAEGSYPLARKLFIYFNQASASALSPAVREFLRFVCSRQAQEVAARDGNFPIDAALAAKECAPGA